MDYIQTKLDEYAALHIIHEFKFEKLSRCIDSETKNFKAVDSLPQLSAMANAMYYSTVEKTSVNRIFPRTVMMNLRLKEMMHNETEKFKKFIIDAYTEQEENRIQSQKEEKEQKQKDRENLKRKLLREIEMDMKIRKMHPREQEKRCDAKENRDKLIDSLVKEAMQTMIDQITLHFEKWKIEDKELKESMNQMISDLAEENAKEIIHRVMYKPDDDDALKKKQDENQAPAALKKADTLPVQASPSVGGEEEPKIKEEKDA